MPPTEKPTFKQALLITAGGLFFGLFSCVGALVNMGNGGSQDLLMGLGFVGLALGLVVMLVGIVLVLWVAVRPFLRTRPVETPGSATPQSAPGEPAPTSTPTPALESPPPPDASLTDKPEV
jgi:hypothetical protein